MWNREFIWTRNTLKWQRLFVKLRILRTKNWQYNLLWSYFCHISQKNVNCWLEWKINLLMILLEVASQLNFFFVWTIIFKNLAKIEIFHRFLFLAGGRGGVEFYSDYVFFIFFVDLLAKNCEIENFWLFWTKASTLSSPSPVGFWVVRLVRIFNANVENSKKYVMDHSFESKPLKRTVLE